MNFLQIGQKYLRGPFVVPSQDDEMLETVTLMLEYEIAAPLSQNSEINLRCIATIATIYWRSAEVNLELETPMNILDHHASRADKVRAAESSKLQSKMTLVILCLVIVAKR